jgi:(p)ppGpp synthase/HD superfamily hydrolase
MKSIFLQDRYLAAMRFAAEAHQGQLVPGSNLPYLLHLSTVAMEVVAALAIEAHENPDLAVACAVLHDVIEDTAITYKELEQHFGRNIADGVLALSKNPMLPKDQQIADSLQRIQQQPHEVWMVKLADRITNLQQPPADWPGEKITRYRIEAQQILAALAPASDALAMRLQQKIALYAAYE